jgi:hypothetical protein
MNHLKQDEILSFAAGQMDAGLAERVYEHLDACSVCAQRYEAIEAIRSDFEASWDGFVEEFAARSVSLTSVAKVGKTVEVLDLAVRGLLDGSRRLATAALEHVAGALQGFGRLEVALCPAYSGVGDTAAAADVGRLTDEASTSCGEGNIDEAWNALEEASRLDRRACSSASLALLARDRKIGEITVDAERRSISVLIFEHTETRDMAVLSLAQTEMRAELAAVEGASYRLAEFENVPDGPFSLRVEMQAV